MAEADVELVLLDTGDRFPFWSSFSLEEKFGAPGQTKFTFEIEDPRPTTTDFLSRLKPGSNVQVVVEGYPYLTGYIDEFETKGDRSGGTKHTVRGCDSLGHVIDANVPPTFTFAADAKVVDIVSSLLAELGLKTISLTDEANRIARTGYKQGGALTTSTRTVQREVLLPNGDGTFRTAKEPQTVSITKKGDENYAELTVQAMKPKVGEGAWEYAHRILKRFGLTIWATADGTGAVIGRPTYDGPVLWALLRTQDGRSNVLDGTTRLNAAGQPTVVVATTKSGGGKEFGKSRVTCVAVNELVASADDAAVKPVLNQYKHAIVIPPRPEIERLRPLFADVTPHRPMYLEDNDSKNLAQLQNAVRRELTTRQRDCFYFTYTVTGLSQNGTPFKVNETAQVTDELLNYDGPLWVEGVSMKASRSEGATTQLTLCPPGLFVIGE